MSTKFIYSGGTAFLYMPINLPAHVIIERFGDDIGFLADIYGSVVLKAGLTDILHERLQVRDFHNAVAAKSFEFVVCEFALAGINTYDTGWVIGGGSAKSGFIRSNPADYCTICIFFTNRTSDDFLVIHLCALEKRFWQIAAMEKYTFIRIIAIIVVPIQQRTRRTAGQL